MTLSREEALILRCARLQLTDELVEVVKQTVAEGLRWDEFLRLTARHQIQPLWFRHLQQLGDSISILPEVTGGLEAAYRQTLGTNLFMIAELQRLLKHFQLHHIEVMLLKGAALLPTIYRDDWGVRVLGDIDLLVQEEDLLPVRDHLYQCGYSATPFPSQAVDTLAEHLPPFIKGGNGRPSVAVEVHVRLGYPTEITTYRCLPTERLWANAKVVAINGTPAFRPGDEDLLESLCLHLWAHIYGNPFAGLRRWWDIVEILQQAAKTMDWDCLFWNVRADHTESYLVESLCFLARRMDVRLPQEIMLLCRPVARDSASEQIFVSLFTTTPPGQRHGKIQLAFLLTIPGVTQKLRYLVRLLFPDREFLRNRYRHVHFNVDLVYYVVRIGEALLRGLATSGQIAWRGFRRSSLRTGWH